MGRAVLCAGIPEPGCSPFGLATIDWQRFQEFLVESYYLKTQQDYFRYAREFSNVLTTGDASPLLRMSNDRRRHVMSSLSALSAFTGVKDYWKQIISKYGLRWRANGTNGLDHIIRLISTDRFSDMVNEIKRGLEVVPPQYSNFVKFATLTGLRPSEAIMAANMLRDNGHNGYLNEELQVLEHYRYPKFLRGKKNAYVSVMDSELLQTGHDTANVNYRELQNAYYDRGLGFNMAFGRKIFGTFMRRFVTTETVDLLEGRTPSTIFAKHYFQPDFKTEIAKIRTALPELRKLLL